MKRGSLFKNVEMQKPKSTTFDLSHDKKMSANMGLLIPTLLIDALPGDRFTLQTSHLMRLAPLLAPVMHEVNVYMHYFFVPNRLVWPNWEKFITGGDLGLDMPVFPKVTFSDSDPYKPEIGTLADYFGIPEMPAGSGNIEVSAIPFAAYNKIYNEYYRDQNLTPRIDDELVDGLNNGLPRNLKRRAWEHDYFTSALPWTQKGVEATIPLGEYADLEFYGVPQGNPLVGTSKWRDIISGNAITTATRNLQVDTNGDIRKDGFPADNGVIDITDHTRVKMNDITINELRAAVKLQQWLEKTARGGSRYIEMIMSHFGVKSSDARLQRPEYLGGGRSRIQFGEVFATVKNDQTELAELGGRATNASTTKKINYFCEEHGYIMGIMSIVPRTGYMQGYQKHFLKFDKLDFGWPSFAALGEQEVKQIEIWPYETTKDDVFGYTPRYAEYKYISNSVHGDFRQTLEYWHMSRKFDNKPLLNTSFIECEPTQRIFALEDETHKCWMHIYNDVKANRRLPAYGTPSL